MKNLVLLGRLRCSYASALSIMTHRPSTRRITGSQVCQHYGALVASSLAPKLMRSLKIPSSFVCFLPSLEQTLAAYNWMNPLVELYYLHWFLPNTLILLILTLIAPMLILMLSVLPTSSSKLFSPRLMRLVRLLLFHSHHLFPWSPLLHLFTLHNKSFLPTANYDENMTHNDTV